MNAGKRGRQAGAAAAAVLRQALLVLATVLVLAPLAYIILGAGKTKLEYIRNPAGLPVHFTLANFAALLKDGMMLLWFRNSVVVTVLAVLLSLAISALAAYAFARIRFAGREKIFNLIISLMIMPPIVMLIPLFVLASRARLVNTYWSAVFIYNGLMLPFNIYLLRNFFVTVPEALVESARLDGCGHLAIFWRIMLPLAASALVTLTVVSVLWVWNELLIALIFLQKNELTTLMAGLVQFQGRFRVNQPMILAGVLASMVPMIAIYLAGQRFFVRGLTAGALKGE